MLLFQMGWMDGAGQVMPLFQIEWMVRAGQGMFTMMRVAHT
jgi:hypothetical protein